MAPRLHEDVLRLIFAQIARVDEHNISTLLRLAQVSRQFYVLVLPMIYRSLHVNARWKSQKRKLEALATRLATRTEVVSFVREIHIDDIYRDEEFVEQFLTDLIPNLTQLDAFYWSPAGKDFLQTVKLIHRHWPRCQLHPLYIDIGSSVGREMVNIFPHMLRDFRLSLPVEPRSGQTAKVNFIHAIKHCPNMQTLEVYQHSSRCVSFGPWMDSKARLDISSGDKLSRPSEVRIMSLSIPWDDFRQWGKAGGWSNLRKLTLRDAEWLDLFQGCEATLRSLRLVDASEEAVEDSMLDSFCANLAGLKEMGIIGRYATIPLKTLRGHGAPLERLEVHRYNPGEQPSTDIASCNATQPLIGVDGLDQWCPNLSYIALDIFRNGDEWVWNCVCYTLMSLLMRSSHTASLRH